MADGPGSHRVSKGERKDAPRRRSDRRAPVALTLLAATSLLLLGGGVVATALARRAALASVQSRNLALAESMSRLSAHFVQRGGEALSASDWTDLWDGVQRSGATEHSLCVLDAQGRVAAHSQSPSMIGTDLGALRIAGPDRAPSLESLIAGGVAFAGEAAMLGGQRDIVAVAPLSSGGGVLVKTPRRAALAAQGRASLPWIALTGLAAVALLPLTGMLLLQSSRQSRREAQRREAEVNLLFNSDAFGVALLDRDLRYIRINERMASLHGVPAEAFPGRSIHDAPQPIADRVAPILREVIETGLPRTRVEVRIPGEDGERVFNASYLPLIGASGRVEGVASVVLEVTDLERTRGELRDRESVHRTIIETAREGVWMLDEEDRTSYLNARMEEILQRPASALLGRPMMEAFPPEARERALRNIDHRRAGAREEFLMRFRRPDGQEAALRLSTAPLMDEAGRYKGAVALVTDLTDRQEAERLLRLSDERFEALVRTQGEFIVRWRPDGTLLYVNDAYCEHFGRTRDDLLGDSFLPLIPEEDRRIVHENLRKITAESPSVTVEHRVHEPDGSIGWMQWTDRGVFSASGELVELISIGRDITPLKRAEEHLRERERILSHAQRLAGFGSWRWAVGADRAQWSEGQHRLYGLTPEEHTPTLEGLLSLVRPEDRDRCRRAVFNALDDHQPRVIEFRITRPDGAERTLQSAMEVLLDEDGHAKEVIGATVDMTERRIAQRRRDIRTRALEKIAAGAGLAETLETIALGVERMTPGARCMVTLADEQGAMRVLSAPNQPEAYVRAVEGLPAGPGVGSCGACIADGRRVVAADTQSHPNWAPFRDLAREAGVMACWSEPILGNAGEVIGSFSITFPTPRQPDEEGEETLRATAQLAGITINRLRTQEALALSEGRFRSLVESLDAVFWFAEPDPLTVRFVSPAFERVWGRPREELYSDAWIWNKAIHEDDRDRVRAAFEHWLRSDGASDYSEEYRILRPDGAMRWIRDKGAFLPPGPDGRLRVAGLAEDITERKEEELLLERLNEELRDQRATLETILTSSSDLIFMYDETGRFTYANPAASRALGVDLERYLGRRPIDLPFPRESLSPFWEDLQSSLVQGVAEHGLAPMEVAGETRFFDYVINPAQDEEGRVIGAVCSARDITQMRHAEQRLRLALQQLRFHVENTPLAIVEWDAQFRVLRWSHRAEEMFGWRADEVVDRPWSNWFIHEEDLPRVERVTQRLLDRVEERNTCTNRNRTRDGRVVHCEWHNSVLFGEDGEMISVMSFAQDVTDRVRAEEALRESEERLRLAMEATTDGVWDWNIVTDEVDWSDRVYEIFGLDPDETEPSFELVRAMVDHEDRARWERAAEEHFDCGAPYDIEFRVRRADGRRIWVRAVGRAVRDGAGRPVRMVGSASDVTERREASEALRQAKQQLEQRVEERTRDLVAAHDATARSEARFRSIFENTGVGVALIDHLGRLTQANPAFERLFAPAPDAPERNGESQRQAWSRLREACPELEEVASGAAGELQREARLVGADGEELWLRLAAHPLPGLAGEQDAAVVIVENITERRRAEEEARRRQTELAHAARLITAGELAAGLAHELNQPLAAIAAYADGCSRQLHASGAPAQPIELLGKISGQARRAGQIIHRLKDLVRKQTPQTRSCRLDVLLAETVDLVSSAAAPRDASFRVRVPSDLPPVAADWVQLQQVFVNLLTNAIDAMSDADGSDRAVAIDAALDDAGQVRVIVEDTGPGLHEDDMDRLFESFYSTKVKGMGLGLPISRSIMEAHGGRLWCEPTGGRGARFVLMIPIARQEVGAEQ